VLRCNPDLPAAPQLPNRSPREGVVAQWAIGIPGVRVRPDGSLEVGDEVPDAPIVTTFDREAHGGLLEFLDVASAQPKPPSRVKVQVAGPLTLGTALAAAGWAVDTAFAHAVRASRAWSRALERLVRGKLPDAAVVVLLDEPALVKWRGTDAPIDRESATDLLSSALAAPGCVTGVHVCGDGDVRLALDAGPKVLQLDVDAWCFDDALPLSRHLEADGWVCWGAVPTDRPVGENAAPLWKGLLDLWCELTRRGCDPVRVRSQALLSPACGLAGHGLSQAERALRLARELGARVHEHAAATKLAVGA
jgi:hypothetical protein